MSEDTHAARSDRWTLRPRRARATLASWRGHFWALVIACDFYLMSNPLVFEPIFGVSLQRAVLVTAVAVTVSIPWLRVPRIHPGLVAFFVWGLASVLWSIQPSATISTFGLYLTIAALAVATYANVDGKVLALGFTYGGVLVTALSVYSFQQRLPGAYYEALAGTVLTGVGTNQNILAYTVTLGMCGWLALWPRGPVLVLLWLCAGACLLCAVYLAESTSGYLTAAAVVVTAGIQRGVSSLRDRGWTRRRLATSGVALCGVVIVAAAAAGFSGHGPGTFSDRMPFWRATWDVAVAAGHPVVGYGWGAVWAHPWSPAPPNGVVESIYEAAGLALTHGHNSFMDLLIDVGVIGVVIAAGLVITVARDAVRQPMGGRSDDDSAAVRSRFVMLCIVALLVFGVTEPMLVIPVGFWAFVLLMEPSPTKVVGLRSRLVSTHA